MSAAYKTRKRKHTNTEYQQMNYNMSARSASTYNYILVICIINNIIVHVFICIGFYSYS